MDEADGSGPMTTLDASAGSDADAGSDTSSDAETTRDAALDTDSSEPDASTSPAVDYVPTPAALGAALDANEVVVGAVVRVTVSGDEPVALSLPIPAGFASDTVRVLVLDGSGTVRLLPVEQWTVSDSSVVVSAATSGSYAAVATIEPACAPLTLQANLDLQNDAALAVALAGGHTLDQVTRLEGNLSIGGTTTSLAKLRCLTWVTGDVIVQNAANLSEVSLPGLASVGGYVQLQSLPKTTAVTLPRLAKIGRYPGGESLYLRTLPELTNVDVHSLAEAAGGLELSALSSTADQDLTLDFGALRVLGNTLTLDGVQTLTSVGGLSGLADVAGSVVIQDSTDLVNLAGLGALRRVGGNVLVIGNRALQVAPLAALANVAGYVQFENDAKLTEIELPTLTDVGRYPGGQSLYFRNLPELTALHLGALGETPSGLELRTLAATADATLSLELGSLRTVRGSLVLDGVARLSTLAGFARLASVDGSIDVRNAANLSSLAGLGSLSEVGGDLLVIQNPVLTECAFPALSSVGGYVQFENDARLAEIALPKLESLGRYPGGQSLYLRTLPELTDLSMGAIGETPSGLELRNLSGTADRALTLDLAALRIVRGSVSLDGVAALHSLDGLAQLSEVSGSVDVRNCTDLTTLSGLDGLASLGENLIVYLNKALTSALLPELTTVGGYVQFEGCEQLAHVDLSLLSSLGRYPGGQSVYLRTLARLEAFDAPQLGETPSGLELTTLSASAARPLTLGFGALRIVRGSVSLSGLRNSRALAAFSALAQIDGALTVSSNADLTSLAGFDALSTLGGDLTITANPELPDCGAAAFRDRVRPLGTGTSYVRGNLADRCSP